MAPQVLINLVNTPPLRDAVLVDADHTRLASDGALSAELARVFREWWLESNDHVTPSGLLDALSTRLSVSSQSSSAAAASPPCRASMASDTAVFTAFSD